jgi:hypothetical protein
MKIETMPRMPRKFPVQVKLREISIKITQREAAPYGRGWTDAKAKAHIAKVERLAETIASRGGTIKRLIVEGLPSMPEDMQIVAAFESSVLDEISNSIFSDANKMKFWHVNVEHWSHKSKHSSHGKIHETGSTEKRLPYALKELKAKTVPYALKELKTAKHQDARHQ